jgi:hypothetical protein
MHMQPARLLRTMGRPTLRIKAQHIRWQENAEEPSSSNITDSQLQDEESQRQVPPQQNTSVFQQQQKNATLLCCLLVDLDCGPPSGCFRWIVWDGQIARAVTAVAVHQL